MGSSGKMEEKLKIWLCKLSRYYCVYVSKFKVTWNSHEQYDDQYV